MELSPHKLPSHLHPASDYTMYPFSTQNPKDFQNLLSVYLDATFFPCLRELDFWYVVPGAAWLALRDIHH